MFTKFPYIHLTIHYYIIGYEFLKILVLLTIKKILIVNFVIIND